MEKENLQNRLNEINAEIDQNMKAHNEIVSQRDALINESMARHNMLIGQRKEVMEWLSKFDQPA